MPARPSPHDGDDAPLIRIEGVSKTYPARAGAAPVAALSGIDLAVPKGEILGVIGRSGAGKSTLIRLINGLERPSAGRVVVGGAEVSALAERDLRAVRARVGMIFQHFNLLSSRTAADNVALPLEIAGWKRDAIRTRVADLLALVGLEDQARRYPAELSGGQKQRVGIARALATGPDVLLSDEATSALDPETTRAILALLKRINRDLGLTIVLITHEMSVIRAVADAVAVIEGGAIVERGSVFEVFTRPRAEITRSLLAGETGHGLPPGLAARIGPEPLPGAAPVLRLVFRGAGADTAVIARLARETGIEAAILAGSVDEIGGQPFGALAVALSAGPDVAARARAFLVGHGVETESLGYLAPNREEARVA
ncbi:methionine ABC transporter ATP-binding protein [Methylobacterium sp. NEAU 140]|uniref:methionine ABC transporter ATP-binding protein n=1 Tax=Methylobacterium sp. NEAU 140 TaxID=3064945 RepID=UPI0027332ECF|nr:methionine ABC transporter ATP-binding protein [Methylobacterium sp. NEAU 140]MDP4021968.1 methionine ABC transporter ATP-binding protein [Methylobacterium sp. NEAU 140]